LKKFSKRPDYWLSSKHTPTGGTAGRGGDADVVDGFTLDVCNHQKFHTTRGHNSCTKNKQQSYFILTGQSDYWTRASFSIKQGILRLPLSHNVHGEADEAC
jgi:hypothetical protein